MLPLIQFFLGKHLGEFEPAGGGLYPWDLEQGGKGNGKRRMKCRT